MKKSVLIFTAGYFPAQQYGGPPVSIKNLSETLSNDYNFYIVTSDHELNNKKRFKNIESGWNKNTYNSVIYLPDSEFSSSQFDNIVKEIVPDMIYLQSLFNYKIVVPALKVAIKRDIPVLIAPRGELLKNALKKKWKKIPYIIIFNRFLRRKNIWFQATSEEEKKAITHYFPGKKIVKLSNIPTVMDSSKCIIHNKDKGELNMLFLSRIVPKKNLLNGLNALKKVSGKVRLDIYGPIEDASYWQNCLKVIDELPDNVKVRYRGIVNHEYVQDTFSKYDLFFFPTLSENFGHVIAESINSNCPFLTSVNTPWNDVNNYECSWTVDTSDITAISEIIQKCINFDNTEYFRIIKNLENYRQNKMNPGNLYDLYRSIITQLIQTKGKDFI